jgi:hypothetical protein
VKQEEISLFRLEAFAAKHGEQTMLKVTFVGCKSQSRTSLDVKDQNQCMGQSRSEYVVSLWFLIGYCVSS